MQLRLTRPGKAVRRAAAAGDPPVAATGAAHQVAAEGDAAPAGAEPGGEAGRGAGHGRLAAAALVAGIGALAFNLRPAITSLPPVFPELAARLHLSAAAVTALATIPVVCFGVFSGIAARLARRFGDEHTLFAALIVLAASLALRGAFPGAALFPATVSATGAIAIMNVLLSGMIKRRAPARAGLVVGLYLLSLSAGSIIASLISVPVYQAAGGSVRPVLGLWAVPATLAVLAWLPQLRHGAAVRAARRVTRAGHAVHRRMLAWQVAAFMGLQSLTFYSTLSWLPTLFRDRGASPAHAGVLLSLMTLGGLPAALLMPVLAHRAADQRTLVIPTVLLSGAGIAAALFAPLPTAAIWMLALGLAQGASLGLAIFFTMARAATPAIAASLSGLAQSAGYLVASAGPLLVGLLHSATGRWTSPVILLLAVTLVELAAGYLAARGRVIS